MTSVSKCVVCGQTPQRIKRAHLLPPFSLHGFGSIGAAEVCLTDGDEQSVRLTENNVRANFPCDRTADAVVCAPREAPGTAGDDATNNETNGGDSGQGRVHNGIGMGEPDADNRSRQHASDHAAKIWVQKLRWGCPDDMRAAGCPGADGGSGSCGPWDVVLGSDIAALPYASAYDDLLRTIVSLVNSNNKSSSSSKVTDSCIGMSASSAKSGDNNKDSPTEPSGATPHVDDCDAAAADSGGGRGGHSLGSSPMSNPTPAENITAVAAAAAASAAVGRNGSEILQAGGKHQVVVLLAHKRRHASEDTFFEDLRQGLGDEQGVLEIGEEEIHPDFRGSGIRFHMFAVDVGAVGSAAAT